MSSPSSSEIEEKRVTSIFNEADSSTQQEVTKEDKLKDAKSEMGEVKEENERLKMMLSRVEKDYNSLQLRFFDIVNKEVSNKGVEEISTSHDEIDEEPELVSLCLGRSPNEHKKEAKIDQNSNKPKEKEDMEVNLSLGLDSKYMLSMEVVSDLSPMNSSEELPKEVEEKGTLLSSSTNKSTKVINVDDDISDQMPAKRVRVSVRAKCDTPTMNDGCQWRKYGQKIAKGNPCPRAYYRCTVAPACPVRKQVYIHELHWQALAETISKAISTDPSLHSVIAAAVTSIVGQGSNNGGNQEELRDNGLGSGLNLKLGEYPQMVSNNLLNQNGKGCLKGSYFKRLSPTSSQPKNFMLLQPSLPNSLSKSNTTRPSSIVNHINHCDPNMKTHH
ncbi:hypothetical protein TSUD_166750 [Trifolium subterraneum]|uniref:WRKY domain-containing protein n=1 Tax=Trifolium subterraneum TaxID=3900 RepID=A0A2Z6M7C1_TRISU|nr:hypothetical protein TSUD_166750 [Trifolium subterraneum]